MSKIHFSRVHPGWMRTLGTMCVFAGMNCELALPCMSNPCYGESVCLADEQNGGLTYKCICDEIHSGKYCEKTPCYPNPCNFNGKCTLSLADGGGGGAGDATPVSPIFTFMQFSANISQIIGFLSPPLRFLLPRLGNPGFGTDYSSGLSKAYIWMVLLGSIPADAEQM